MKDRKTDEEIEAEIEALKSVKSRLKVVRSAFGEDNLGKIFAQIDALVDLMDEDDVYRIIDNDDWSQEEGDSAIEAIQWMNGESDPEDGTPSSQWEHLCK